MFRNIASFALLVMVVGCGGDSGPALQAVTGKVTKGGQPVANVNVTFSPVSGGVSSGGRTDAEGKFALVCQNGKAGAIEGKHKVVLTAVDVAAATASSDPMAARDAMMKSRESQMDGGKRGAPVAEKKEGAIPSTYNNPSTTPLEYNVAAGNNDFDIVIP